MPTSTPSSDLAAWEARAREFLKEAFVAEDRDGLSVRALYGPPDDRPVPDPFVPPYLRGFEAGGAGAATAFSYRDPSAAGLAEALAADAPMGLDAAWIAVDPHLAAGAPAPAGRGPLAVGFVPPKAPPAPPAAASDTPLCLHAGAAAAALLGDGWADRYEVWADPVLACLVAGRVPREPGRIFHRIERARERAGDPAGFGYRVDGAAFAEAGATPAVELAATVAAAIETVEGARAAAPDRAVRLDVCISAGTVVLDEVAKVRALRRMLAAVFEPGAGAPVRIRLQARMSRRALCVADIWTNLLRGTMSALAGLLGGASAVGVEALDAAVGLPGPTGRRLARNTVTIVREETGLGRLVDPLAGGYALEARTEALLRAGWARLRAVAEAGGLLAHARSGALHEILVASRAAERAAVEAGRRPIVGVTMHPDPSLAPPADAVSLDDGLRAPANGPAARALRARVEDDLGPCDPIEPLAPVRLAAAFETQRALAAEEGRA